MAIIFFPRYVLQLFLGKNEQCCSKKHGSDYSCCYPLICWPGATALSHKGKYLVFILGELGQIHQPKRGEADTAPCSQVQLKRGWACYFQSNMPAPPVVSTWEMHHPLSPPRTPRLPGHISPSPASPAWWLLVLIHSLACSLPLAPLT